MDAAAQVDRAERRKARLARIENARGECLALVDRFEVKARAIILSGASGVPLKHDPKAGRAERRRRREPLAHGAGVLSLAHREVPDPERPKATVRVVTNSTFDWLRARGSLTVLEHEAGLRFEQACAAAAMVGLRAQNPMQERVDGGGGFAAVQGVLVASTYLATLRGVVGPRGWRFLVQAGGGGLTIKAIAELYCRDEGLSDLRGAQAYVIHRVREALGILVDHWDLRRAVAPGVARPLVRETAQLTSAT